MSLVRLSVLVMSLGLVLACVIVWKDAGKAWTHPSKPAGALKRDQLECRYEATLASFVGSQSERFELCLRLRGWVWQ